MSIDEYVYVFPRNFMPMPYLSVVMNCMCYKKCVFLHFGSKLRFCIKPQSGRDDRLTVMS